jgi:CHASE1-domain containing sensor protein
MNWLGKVLLRNRVPTAGGTRKGGGDTRALPVNHPGKRKSIWWGYFPVYLVTLLGVMITLYAFREITNWERQRVEAFFRDASGNRILVVKREIKHMLGTVEDIASFFDASKEVSRREFRKFVEPAIRRHGRIKALGWIPRVAAKDKTAFIAEARKSFPPFQIREKDLQGTNARPEGRAEYYPILYVQPYKKNKQLLGLDVAEDPTIFSLLLRAGKTGEMQVSSRIPLVEEGVERSGFMVSVPVYYKDETEAETDSGAVKNADPAQIRGFAFGVFQVGDIVELALESGVSIYASMKGHRRRGRRRSTLTHRA